MQQHGTPVGAVILPGPCIEAFYKECQERFPEIKNLRFRGVENCVCEPTTSREATETHADDATTVDARVAVPSYKAIHLQTEVAASLVDGDAPSLVDFISRNGGNFLPGVRMKRNTKTTKTKSTTHKQQRRINHHSSNDEQLLLDENEKISSSSTTTTKSTTSAAAKSSKFTFVELFAGVGGFRLGLEPLGGSCVLASEKDAMACAFYRRHFGDDDGDDHDDDDNANCDCPELVEGDILDIVSSDFPSSNNSFTNSSFDLLTAGFPCQPFSARGKKKGLEDDNHRGQMYQELVRILMEQQPSFFLFENVVGLVTMDGGRRIILSNNKNKSKEDKYSRPHSFEAGKTMEIVLTAFRSCGYKVEWHVVNCKQFCPQHRERVYFVGSRLDLNCPDVVWENIYPTSDQNSSSSKPSWLVRDFLDQDFENSPFVEGCELSDPQWEMVKRKCGAENNADALTKVGLKIDEPSAPTLISSYKTPASLSARFVTQEADGTLRDGRQRNPRFLTPTEFRRIMGFPDTFEVTCPTTMDSSTSTVSSSSTSRTDGIVDGHVYKVLGNAVVPSVIEAIGREIVRLMEQVETTRNDP